MSGQRIMDIVWYAAAVVAIVVAASTDFGWSAVAAQYALYVGIILGVVIGHRWKP